MNNSDIKPMIEKIESILNACHTQVMQMTIGSRMQIKTLATNVGKAVSMTPKQVLAFVDYFAHNTDIAYVARGKNGGLVRGEKASVPAKKSKKSQTAVEETEDQE